MHKHESPVGYVSDMKILFIVKGSSLISLAYGRSWSSTSSSGIWFFSYQSFSFLKPFVQMDLCIGVFQSRKMHYELFYDL